MSSWESKGILNGSKVLKHQNLTCRRRFSEQPVKYLQNTELVVVKLKPVVEWTSGTDPVHSVQDGHQSQVTSAKSNICTFSDTEPNFGGVVADTDPRHSPWASCRTSCRNITICSRIIIIISQHFFIYYWFIRFNLCRVLVKVFARSLAAHFFGVDSTW